MTPHLGVISQREMPLNPLAHSTDTDHCIISLPTLEKQRQYLRVEASEIAWEANFLSDPILYSSVLPLLNAIQVTEVREYFLQSRIWELEHLS